MQSLMITGGAPLIGSVAIHGAKNSVLPILAAAVLCQSPCVLHNCPQIEDACTALSILRRLGCRVERQGSTIFVDPRGLYACEVPPELARKMRSSVIFLGALTARTGQAAVALPGGCPLGARPIDLHRMALEALGAETALDAGKITCRMKKSRPARITFPFPSVGATENAMLAAMGCRGTVVIENAAREPEIADLAGFLCSAGAEIRGIGSGTLTIEGGRPLHGTDYTILPDRIETATYLCAAAACGGVVTLRQASAETCRPLIALLRESGCTIEERHDVLRISCAGRLKALERVTTGPYPGFPTDIQSPFMTFLTTVHGQSIVRETVFENRFMHVVELNRMGADITTESREAFVPGGKKLHGAKVRATDLRAGAAMVLAGLVATGTTEVSEIYHIERGYENFVQKFKGIGGDLMRVEED